MKNLLSIFILTIAAWTFACAGGQTSPYNSGDAASSQNAATNKQIYRTIGVIKKVDVENSAVTIDHEDIPGFMAAMEMTESVGDKSILNNLKAGDKVDFEIERTDSKLLITKLTKIGEVAVINAAEIYQTNCAECHGARGGGAKKGISLIKGHALHHTEEDFIARVTNGKTKKMPAFKDKLTAEEIAAVVRFVRTDIQGSVKKEVKHTHHNH